MPVSAFYWQPSPLWSLFPAPGRQSLCLWALEAKGAGGVLWNVAELVDSPSWGLDSVGVLLFKRSWWVGDKPEGERSGPLETDPEAGKQGVGEEVRRAGVGEHRGLHGCSCGELGEE